MTRFCLLQQDFSRLEPDEGKLSSPVPRGGVGSNINSLPGPNFIPPDNEKGSAEEAAVPKLTEHVLRYKP